MLMFIAAFAAAIMACLVCFIYAILWIKKRFQSEEKSFDMFRMWAEAPSDFNLQISTSEEPIDFQIAVDQPIEMETEST